MLKRNCWDCEHDSNMTPRWGSSHRVAPDWYSGASYVVEIAATCDSCGRLQSVRGEVVADRNPLDGNTSRDASTVDPARLRSVHERFDAEEWRPTMRHTPDVTYLPDSVAGFVTEAWEARSVNAYRAVLLLARTVIEAAAKTEGIEDGNLYSKIDALAAAGQIRPGAQKVAHAIRVLGNDIAHGDLSDPPDDQDADDILRLLGWVLEDVYQTSSVTEDILRRHQGRSKPAREPDS